jgi:hypothetical protein
MPKKTQVGRGGPPVSFHDDPPSSAKSARYKDIIAKAKSKDRGRLGDLQGTPRFDEVNTSWDSPSRPSHLSESTAAGLQAVAEATAAEQQRREENPYELEDINTPISAANIQDTEPEEELSEDDRLKRAVEGRISEGLDIGQYLMNGEVTQIVPIIPKKLIVAFRTVTDLEESYVDSEMAKEGDMTARAFLRKSNEWALAFHIHQVNGVKWPPTQDGDGTISDKAIQRRLAHVRKLSSPVFTLISKNLAWFLGRVENTLNAEALGNG